MPSGAKKRKAAKKKKENQSNNPTNSSSAPAHSHGDEDVIQHNDRESDVGEISSPTPQDHQNLPAEGEEEEVAKEGKFSNLPSAEGLRIDSGEKHIEVEESAIREFKIEDESDKKHGSVECDEATRKSYNGGSSRSSSGGSSSDDESQAIKNRQAEPIIASVKEAVSLPVKSVDQAVHNSPAAEAGDSFAGSIPAADSEKMTMLGEQVDMDAHSAGDISMAPYAVESAFQENGEEKLISLEDKTSESEASIDAANKRNEETTVQSDERTTTPTTSDPKECVKQGHDDRSTSPYKAPPADNGVEYGKDSVLTQPVGALSPYPVQKTSWKSCCGLFEVFSGSGA